MARKPLRVDEKLTVEVTARRPGWAGWLVGRTASVTRVVRTPSARLRGRWLEVDPGEPIVAQFDTPVRKVVLRVHGHERTLRFARARETVDVGVSATAQERAGSVSVAAAPRAWERMPAPARLSWFPARPRAQALVEPAAGAMLDPDRPITLTFSRPVHAIFGNRLPTITPAAPGRWRHLDTHTLSFEPRGLGYPLSSHIEVRLPEPVELPQASGRRHYPHARRGTCVTARSSGSSSCSRRPATSRSTGARPPIRRRSTARAARRSQSTRRPGTSAGRYATTRRRSSRGIWKTGRVERDRPRRGDDVRARRTASTSTRFVGPKVWDALLADTLAGRSEDRRLQLRLRPSQRPAVR